jgi:predicted nucleic acid-binding protein
MLCYFDSSILLAMLLDEKRKDEANDLWRGAPARVSSLLLKLEATTVLRRTYEHNKEKLNPTWITGKINKLNGYLQEINIRIIDGDIEKIIVLKKELSKCRTLDAIHIATALEFSRLIPSGEFFLYTYDKGMADLAKLCKIKTNNCRNEDFI